MAARASRKLSIKSFIINYLETTGTTRVDRRVLAEICRAADRALNREKPVSRSYVLDVLAETKVEIDRALGGLPVDLRGRVHFHDRDAAAVSLADMAKEYEAAREAGDKVRAEDCRRAVRNGKDRLKLTLRRGLSPEKRDEKQELLQWFLTWLEAPTLFSTWLEARRRAAGAANQARNDAEQPPDR